MVKTVGELRQIIQEMPDDMACVLQFEHGASMSARAIDRIFVCTKRSKEYKDYVPEQAVKEIKEDNPAEEFTTLPKPVLVIDASGTE